MDENIKRIIKSCTLMNYKERAKIEELKNDQWFENE